MSTTINTPNLGELRRLSIEEKMCRGCGYMRPPALFRIDNLKRHLQTCSVLAGLQYGSEEYMHDNELLREKLKVVAEHLEAKDAEIQMLKEEITRLEGLLTGTETITADCAFDEEPALSEQTVKDIVRDQYLGDYGGGVVTAVLRAKHFGKPETHNLRLATDGVNVETLWKDGRSKMLAWKKQPADFVEKLAIETMKMIHHQYDYPQTHLQWKAFYKNRLENKCVKEDCPNWKRDLTAAVKSMLKQEAAKIASAQEDMEE